ncbi:LysR family transcriptional regulator [Ostreibacterium oceani]|uniref:LysR family transcriptional regulator n=1 Tax=Ostreibacterium oceani TaxID=2654998 RepID=A0A6N7EZ30_9GAMM|nr:LysR family transcriptional regulator [Ostreibacterium oceani]MPV86795.1 LysR family transcriptional regulator [Ostreibacterium oceani]
MDFAQLQAFVKVAEYRSFSKAAQALHITQPAISKRISTLESTLDTVLFERLGQRIMLSETGQKLLPEAQLILDKMEHLRDLTGESDNPIRGKLRIATSHHIGLYRLPNMLQQFVTTYPDAQLDMHFTDSEVAHQAVIHGSADIAIATLPTTADNQLDITPLWSDTLMMMLGKSHPLATQKHLDLATLCQYPAILPDEGTFTRRIIDDVLKSNELQCRIAFTTNYLETIKVMVEAGLGWSVLPAIMKSHKLIAHPLASGLASQLSTQSLAQSSAHPPTRSLGVMIHKNKQITPTLSALLTCLYQHTAPNERI